MIPSWARRPETIALLVNVACFVLYLWQWQEPGKILYWAGAILIVLGLMLMKG